MSSLERSCIPCHMTWSLWACYGAMGLEPCTHLHRGTGLSRLLDGPRLVCDVPRLALDAASEARFRRPDAGARRSRRPLLSGCRFRAAGGSLASSRPGLVRKAVRCPKAFWSILSGQRTCRKIDSMDRLPALATIALVTGTMTASGAAKTGVQTPRRSDCSGTPAAVAGVTASVAAKIGGESRRRSDCGGTIGRGGARRRFHLWRNDRQSSRFTSRQRTYALLGSLVGVGSGEGKRRPGHGMAARNAAPLLVEGDVFSTSRRTWGHALHGSMPCKAWVPWIECLYGPARGWHGNGKPIAASSGARHPETAASFLVVGGDFFDGLPPREACPTGKDGLHGEHVGQT